MVACPDIVPAFSSGSVSPSQDGTCKLFTLATYYALVIIMFLSSLCHFPAISAIGRQGSRDPPSGEHS
jgi:hypothetical protein